MPEFHDQRQAITIRVTVSQLVIERIPTTGEFLAVGYAVHHVITQHADRHARRG
jgi:hypothetical protein